MGRERHGPQRGTAGVEFLAPDVRAFGGAPAVSDEHWQSDRPRFADDRPPTRWTTVVFVLGVLTLLGAGVVAAAPWADRQDAAAPSTTLPPPPVETTAPLGGSFDEALAPPGSPVPATGGPRPSYRYTNVDRETPWLVDVPDGFVPVDSFRQPDGSTPGWFQLWAADGASRTSGRWFAVHVAQGSKPVLVAGAERVAYRDGSLLRWTSADGVQQLQFSPTSGYEVRITAYGWSQEHLYGLAASMEVVDNRPYFTMPGPSPDTLRLSRETTAFGLEQEYLGGDAWSFVEWRDEAGGRLALTVAPAQPDAATVGRFVVTASAENAMSGPDVRRDVGTLNATVGRLPGLDGRYAARWAIGETVFSLTGDLSIDELLDLARAVRPAGDGEWRSLEYAVGLTRSTTSNGWVRVSGGRLRAGGSWVLFENVRDGRTSVSIGSLQTAIDVPVGVFRSYATHQGTLVVARLAQTQDAVQIRASADSDVERPDSTEGLLAIDGELVGAILIEELGPVRAELVGPNGRVLFSITASNPAAAG